MYGPRYYGHRYFGEHYFGDGDAVATVERDLTTGWDAAWQALAREAAIQVSARDAAVVHTRDAAVEVSDG